MLLGVSILIWLSFDWMGEYIDFTANKQLREARFGVYLILIASFFKDAIIIKELTISNKEISKLKLILKKNTARNFQGGLASR